MGFDAQTPEQVSIYCPTTRAVASGTWVQVRYKASSTSSWSTAHPLLHVMPDWISTGAPVPVVDAFAGSIFDLLPGTTYDVELTINEPGQSTVVLSGTRATRSLPAVAGTASVTATPADNLAAKIASLVPGSVLLLSNGTYTVNALQLNVSGTVAQPIYIRGESQSGVIISDPTGTVLQVLGVSNVIIENLTIRGSTVDSGIASSSVGMAFWGGGGAQQNITVRHVTIEGVDIGIKSWSKVDGCLVYECTLNGNNPWSEAYTVPVGDIYARNTWNDDGICLPGTGNCAWNNTLHGFGDSFAVFDGVMSAAVFYYRNRIRMTGDDAFEGDYATRNVGWYDNYIANCATFLSLDPLWGGPFYAFRNVCINTLRGPFKFTDVNSGQLIYNNTFIRTDGTSTHGWQQANNGTQRGWAFRNNLFVYRGAGASTVFLSSTVANLDFTHNAWWPDRSFTWNPGGGASLAAAQAGLTDVGGLYTTLRRHSSDAILASSQPFAEAIAIGPDHTTSYTAMQVPRLAAGSVGLGSGIALPGITDGFTGSAPDRGAIIGGRPLPRWGASP